MLHCETIEKLFFPSQSVEVFIMYMLCARTHTYCSDIIDVTYIEPHSMETAEVKGRTRDY